MNKKEKAIELGCQAYSELKDAGIPEQFVPIICSIAQAQRSTFFGSFGSDSGCFIEFHNCHNNLTPVRLVFGIRRYRQPLWIRVKEVFSEGWAILRGHDTEHEIRLNPDDMTKLKDLLRMIE